MRIYVNPHYSRPSSFTVLVTKIGLNNPLKPELLQRASQVGFLRHPPRQLVQGKWVQDSESASSPWTVLHFSEPSSQKDTMRRSRCP